MCGICGYFGSNAVFQPLAINKLNHRGPDENGIKIGRNFKFGHTRLSIIDIVNGQ